MAPLAVVADEDTEDEVFDELLDTELPVLELVLSSSLFGFSSTVHAAAIEPANNMTIIQRQVFISILQEIFVAPFSDLRVVLRTEVALPTW